MRIDFKAKKNFCHSFLAVFGLFIFVGAKPLPTYKVMFTKKNCNPAKELVVLLDDAQKHIAMACYELNHPLIMKSLVRASQRGVQVEIVSESDNLYKSSLVKLTNANISVVADNNAGLMHNKFVVIDDEIVWTGSLNFTLNGVKKNNNNSLYFYSPDLAKIYLKEFNEMYHQKIFGNKTQSILKDLSPRQVNIENTKIKVLFSPDDNVLKELKKQLSQAQHSIYFLAFSFTSPEIGDLLVQKQRAGVKIRGVVEERGSMSRYSQYVKMKCAGIDVIKDKNKRGCMHHKVFIIDEKIVITGSFNFSKNAAQKNDENLIIINNKKIALSFKKEAESLM